jgi:GlpG protein
MLRIGERPMRTIGNLASEKAASHFADFLYVRGIESQVEPEDDGTFSLWIIDESHVARAAEWLAHFRKNPHAPEFADATEAADKKHRAEAKAERGRRATVADVERVAFERRHQAIPHFTILLIVVSAAVGILSQFGENIGAIHSLFISDLRVEGEFIAWAPGLADVRAGQVWRLITPIFIHFGLMHILFNMMMLHDLGAFIERRFSAWYLCVLVLVSAALSNVAQFWWAGPIFGGMSGVDYALFGFVWMRGRFGRTERWQLHQNTVLMVIGWFVLCLVGLIPHVANACHTVGLAVGMFWGWASGRWSWRR